MEEMMKKKEINEKKKSKYIKLTLTKHKKLRDVTAVRTVD